MIDITPLPQPEWERRIGSSYKGYINSRFDQLIAAFGYPNSTEGTADGKVQLEWVLLADGNAVFTIYPWKDKRNPWIIERWHIGCHTLQEYDLIIEALKEREFDPKGNNRVVPKRKRLPNNGIRGLPK